MEKFGLLALQGGSGGGGGLPPVTSADNGKVLAVENGSWAAADNDFVVSFTKSGSTWSADKLMTDIADAVSAKKRVYGKVAASLVSSNSTFSTETFLLPLFAKPATISYGYQFGGAYQTGTTTLFVNIVVALVPPLNQAVTAYVKEIELAPAPLVVNYTITGQPSGNAYLLSADKTYSEIAEAVLEGREIKAVLSMGDHRLTLPHISDGTGFIAFSGVTQFNEAWVVFHIVTLNSGGSVSSSGLIIPLNTTQMSYNTTSGELAITNVPEVSA